MKYLENIKRGKLYEDEALHYFCKVSSSSVEKCGFFLHPDDARYGSSPDALGPAGIIIEVKTRAKKKFRRAYFIIKRVSTLFYTMSVTDGLYKFQVLFIGVISPRIKNGNIFLNSN